MDRLSRMIVHILILQLILVVNFSYSRFQEIKFERIGREQGLTTASVQCIVQDRQGFIWFGTEDGLFRYDGYGMTIYKHDPLDPTSLASNDVLTMLRDCNGRLWLGTAAGGLSRFDHATEQFTHFKHIPGDSNSLSSNTVNMLLEDRSGAMWVGTMDGLNRFEQQTEKITSFVFNADDKTNIMANQIFAICEDSDFLWIGTMDGLFQLDPDTGERIRFVKDPQNPCSLSDNRIHSIYRDRAGQMWIGTYAGLDLFHPVTQDFSHFSIYGRGIVLYEDRFGSMWIGTQNHLQHFDGETGAFTRFSHDRTDPFSLRGNRIQVIYEDRIGVLWIGTNNGAHRLDRGQFPFKQIYHIPEDSDSPHPKSPTALHEDRDGALWIATTKVATDGLNTHIGIDKIDRDTGQIEHILINPDYFTYPGPMRRRIIKIKEDRSGVFWFGGRAGLARFDPKTAQFSRFQPQAENQIVWDIHEDRSGRLWVLIDGDSPSRVYQFDREQEKFRRIDFDTKFALPDNQVNRPNQVNIYCSISEGQSGRLWFSTLGDGLFLLNPDSDLFIQFIHEPGNPNSLSHNVVGPVYEDRAGKVWAAPWHGGLNKLDPETGKVTVYTEKHGLASSFISSILEDDRGQIWLTTFNGISCFDPQSATFKNFDVSNGVVNTRLGGGSFSLKSQSGELFFGFSEDGIDYVHPDSIRDNPYIPPVVFTRFIRYNSDEESGQPIVEKGLSEKQRFDLSYNDHTLIFEFVALNYRTPHKNQYAYKLEGFLDEWVHLGNKHNVTLTTLKPGEYILRVKGSNNDGVWNEEGASLVINISPPWWQTDWAYMLYVALIGFSLYGLYRFEKRRTYLRSELERQIFESKKLKEVDELKSHFFANISHEFRTPLTLILGPLDKLLNESFPHAAKQQFQLMKQNAKRLRQLINQLLDLSKVESGKMRLAAKQGNVVHTIRRIVSSFSYLAESKDIILNIVAPEECILAYFDNDKFEKIISNLLSNALKFTPKGGEIWVEVPGTFKVPGTLEIYVKDTGKGISSDHKEKIFDRFYQLDTSNTREEEGTGIGLALIKEFVELHHGEIRVESEPGKGSTFTVLLPLGREHLHDDEIIEDSEGAGKPAYEMSEAIITNDLDSNPDSENITHETGQPKVLVVEDNVDMQRYICQSLADSYALLQAENGQTGMQLAFENIPDLIISDVMMPEMDGFAFCKKLKSDQRTNHIPVILLTARAGQADKLAGLEIGADDYLTKPFDTLELRSRVRNLITQRQKLRERFEKEIILGTDQVAIASADEQFIKKVMMIVQAHVTDSDFNIEIFTREVGFSRFQLHRKLHALTGLSASRFIRVFRLKRAAEMLKQHKGSVAEIAFEVGFNSLPHFHRCFREQFNKTPSQFISKPQE